MKNIPIDVKSVGPHDCSFDSKIVHCACTH